MEKQVLNSPFIKKEYLNLVKQFNGNLSDAFKKTNRFRIINFFSKLYSTFLVPIIGRWISGHSNAYQYLNYSIEKFFTLDELGTFFQEKHFIVRKKQTFLFGSVGVLVVRKSN